MCFNTPSLFTITSHSRSSSYYLLLENNEIRRTIDFHIERCARLVFLRLRMPCEYTRAIVTKQLDLFRLKGCQTFEKTVLFETGSIRHRRVWPLQKKFHAHGETSHVHWKLSSGYPTVIKTGKLSVLHDRRA